MIGVGNLINHQSNLDIIDQYVEDLYSSRDLPSPIKNVIFTDDDRYIFYISKNTIHYSEIKERNNNHLRSILVFDSSPIQSEAKEISKEEKLRRERMRASFNDVTSFYLHQESKQLLIPGPSIFLYNIKSSQLIEIDTQLKGSRIDPKFSPDGNYVSFIHNNDIYITTLKGQETRITYSNDTITHLPTRTCGITDFIIQEEFSLYSGYEWFPKLDKNHYYILYIENDLSKVDIFNIPEHGIEGTVEQSRYSRVGRDNTISNLSIAFIEDKNGLNVKTKTLRPSLKERFPWMEYLTRFGWSNNKEYVYFQIVDRKQEHMLFGTIHINEFKEDNSDISLNDPMKGIQILHEETSDNWINICDLIYFYKNSNRILFSTEKNGFRHLLLITLQNNGSVEKRFITNGTNWQVDGDFIDVDEKNELVYFTGSLDSPLEYHLYVASTAENSNPEKIHRLTPLGLSHCSISMNSSKTIFLSCSSSIKESYKTQIYEIHHSMDDQENTLLSSSSSILASFPKTSISTPFKFDIIPPEIFTFKNTNGHLIYGCYFKPRNFDIAKKYPTILKVYGGPHVQLIENSQKLILSNLHLQMYAHLGYLCVIIDGCGSARRGLKFESYLKKRMGTFEVQEQVEGLSYLIKKGFVDTERIAVTGWSYGGYLSLMCLAQRPDFFKLAISGAPVVRWEAYDTGYTERYMSTIEDNKEGYKKGSVLNYVNGFPSEPNRLLILHGIIDDNVHFCNTLELIQSLIEHDKPYQLQVYPKERHGIRDRKGLKHSQKAILRFIIDYL